MLIKSLGQYKIHTHIMKFSTALKILLTSGSLKTTTASSASTIEDAVKDGCKNSIDFESQFVTDAGDKCSTCHFCSGQKLSDVFDPKKDICIDCNSSDNVCNTLQIITKFEKAFVMEFVSITSSNMESKYDPAKIVIKKSTDSKSWDKLFDSSEKGELIFSGRNQQKDFLLSNNDKELNHYMILFKVNDTESKMHLKQYGIVEAYTKLCTSKFHKAITDETVMPYKTLSPTHAPTDSPTIAPTKAPNTAAPTGAPLNWRTIIRAVDDWMWNESEAITKYGHIKDWNTSEVISMKNLFSNHRGAIKGRSAKFNEDISKWDVSKVTDFSAAFLECKVFNVDISTWNVSSATGLASMFYHAEKFNVDISGWNVSKNKGFQAMFFMALSFNVDLNPWDVSSATSMKTMFYRAESFNQELCWVLSDTVTTTQMFYNSGKNVC